MGLDLAAVAFVLRRLRKARDRGVGVLLFSEDLDEQMNGGEAHRPDGTWVPAYDERDWGLTARNVGLTKR